MQIKKIVLVAISLFTTISFAQIPTQIKIFTPFVGKNLRSDLKVMKQVQGYCWTFSLRTNQPNAWRCMTGNLIQDPCFINTAIKPNTAICVNQPWNNQITVMQLTKPLPPRKIIAFNPKKSNAWFVDLANGDRCQYMTGASSGVNGMRINYACKKDTYIVGDLDSSSPSWTANYYHMKPGVMNPTNAKLDKVPVKTVWY